MGSLAPQPQYPPATEDLSTNIYDTKHNEGVCGHLGKILQKLAKIFLTKNLEEMFVNLCT